MKNYGLRWTDPHGTPRAGGVNYDKASADDRKKRLADDGATDIEIVEVKAGERLQPKS